MNDSIKTFEDFVGQLTVTYKRTKLPTQQIRQSSTVDEFIRPFYEEVMDDVEHVKVIHLNRNNKVVNVHHLSSGTDCGALISVKDIMRHAILIKTHALILVHNHPSGTLKPSNADIEITEKVKNGARLLDLQLLDHLIITREGYYSFADEGLL